MKNKMNTTTLAIKSIRRWTIFFMVSLSLSGITAIPVQQELSWILQYEFMLPPPLIAFIKSIYDGLNTAEQILPQLLYGYDWLAFSHIIIALFFIGVLKNPEQNIWVVEAGIIACLLIFPFAFICGHIRNIPFWWQLIDCSFGAFGLIPLIIIHKKIESLNPNK